LAIGIAQPMAFIPGTSRSGIAVMAARMTGYERAEAARFSFPALHSNALAETIELHALRDLSPDPRSGLGGLALSL